MKKIIITLRDGESEIISAVNRSVFTADKAMDNNYLLKLMYDKLQDQNKKKI